MKQNWEYKKLGDVATFINGYPFKPSEWKSEGCPIIRIQNLNNPLVAYNYYDKPLDERYIVKSGDVLISWSGTLGVYEWSGEKAFLNQHIFKVLFNKGEINKSFFKYVVSSRIQEMKSKVHGITMQHITKGDFDKTKVPVPPLSEQSRIVAELDLLTGIIDKQNVQLKELDNLAQAIFYDMFGDPIENPKGWEVKKLGEVTNKISDGVHAKPHYTESGMPFISVVNINRGKLNFEGCKFVSQTDGKLFNKRTKPEKGDVLYTKVGATYGISALIDVDVEFCLYVSVCLIKPKREIFDSLFLTHMMRLPYVKNQADERIRGIGVPDLHLNQISAFDIIVPPLALQQSFAEKIQSIEKQKETIRASIADTQKLLDYTMDKYFG